MLLYLAGRIHGDPSAGEHMKASMQILRIWQTYPLEEHRTDVIMKRQYWELLRKLSAHALLAEPPVPSHTHSLRSVAHVDEGSPFVAIERRVASLDAEMRFTSVDQISEVFGDFSTGPGLAYLQTVKDFHQSGSKRSLPLSAVRAAEALLAYGRKWESAVSTWMSHGQPTNRHSRIQLLILLACHWFGEALIEETLWSRDAAINPWTRLSPPLLDTARAILDIKRASTSLFVF